MPSCAKIESRKYKKTKKMELVHCIEEKLQIRVTQHRFADDSALLV